MNKITVKIGDKDYTNKVSYPFKFADLLDERLDEAYFTLLNVRDRSEPFTPLTLVEVTIECSPESKVIGARSTQRNDILQDYDSSTKRLTQILSKRFVVATDKVSESPLGDTNVKARRVYTHELYVIEETKILEGFIGDSLAFTNPLGNNYSNNNNVAPPPVEPEPEPTPEYTVTVQIQEKTTTDDLVLSANSVVLTRNNPSTSIRATVGDTDNYKIGSFTTVGDIYVTRSGDDFVIMYMGNFDNLTSNVTAKLLINVSDKIFLIKKYRVSLIQNGVENAVWIVGETEAPNVFLSIGDKVGWTPFVATVTEVKDSTPLGKLIYLSYPADDIFFAGASIGEEIGVELLD